MIYDSLRPIMGSDIGPILLRKLSIDIGDQLRYRSWPLILALTHTIPVYRPVRANGMLRKVNDGGKSGVVRVSAHGSSDFDTMRLRPTGQSLERYNHSLVIPILVSRWTTPSMNALATDRPIVQLTNQ